VPNRVVGPFEHERNFHRPQVYFLNSGGSVPVEGCSSDSMDSSSSVSSRTVSCISSRTRSGSGWVCFPPPLRI
jgi:hypothetical protein